MVIRGMLDIFTRYKSDLDLVEAELDKNMRSNQPELMEICNYLSNLKGKRFRPLIIILSYKFVGGKDIEEIIPLASSIELIHTATLIHDDMNDHSTLRRGRPTVYRKYGMSKALISGDFLFSLGFKLGGSYGKDIVNIVAELSTKLAEGEFIHLQNSRNPLLTEDTYFDIVERKTAGPIIGGVKIGALIGKAKPEDVTGLGEYGKNVGIAFQIVDDIFDLVGSESNVGKPVGVDLKAGKITLTTILALNELPNNSRLRLIDIIKNENMTESENQEALELIRSTNAIDSAFEKANSYIDSALAAISDYESYEYYSSLVELAKYTVERKY